MIKKTFFWLLNLKQVLLAIALLLFLTAANFWLYSSTVVSSVATEKVLRGKKIVIDAGHGGIDGGTGAAGVLEKNINLAVAKKLRAALAGGGATVVMTRDKDDSLDHLNNSSSSRHRRDLCARTEIIRANRPDLFISLHTNSSASSTTGTIVFYQKKNEKSKSLATHLQCSFDPLMKKNSFMRNLPLTADFYLLRNSSDPGVIVEMGFVTNSRERVQLTSDRYQKELALSMANGIKNYLAHQGKKDHCQDRLKGSNPPPAKDIETLRQELDLETVSTLQSRRRPQIALVIDDMAMEHMGVKELLALDCPLTLAILPGYKQCRELDRQAYFSGHQVILHLPMEPEIGKAEWLKKGAITAGMPPDEIRRVMLSDLSQVPHATGFNNHMGSLITKTDKPLQAVLEVAAEKRLIVLDSRTTDGSLLAKKARLLGIPTVERSVFLDQVNSVPAIQEKIRYLVAIAQKRGTAVGIGHAGETGPNTAAAIKSMLPWLRQEGIDLVYLSELTFH